MFKVKECRWEILYATLLLVSFGYLVLVLRASRSADFFLTQLSLGTPLYLGYYILSSDWLKSNLIKMLTIGSGVGVGLHATAGIHLQLDSYVLEALAMVAQLSVVVLVNLLLVSTWFRLFPTAIRSPWFAVATLLIGTLLAFKLNMPQTIWGAIVSAAQTQTISLSLFDPLMQIFVVQGGLAVLILPFQIATKLRGCPLDTTVSLCATTTMAVNGMVGYLTMFGLYSN
ncbi:hypothetical protein [Vibrio sp. 10N]|uniref:hypothetical protein n=1 Tax=Vibrio sp. 10N TaxID=3058938 RepID=UPI0028132206|nr:hypothetical protein VB10N_47020 [Vibrio sp. 10N]